MGTSLEQKSQIGSVAQMQETEANSLFTEDEMKEHLQKQLEQHTAVSHLCVQTHCHNVRAIWEAAALTAKEESRGVQNGESGDDEESLPQTENTQHSPFYPEGEHNGQRGQ
ncbi:uncharacterized protein LOC142356742 isoform X2 [Convolutriloba macropyga]|uniref:uncharacterized protein LOC142356742 isoform X2 n=1 Tax=Convolutriloba macropyga TaxID=536237 RepID=UPI003F51EB70